MEFRGVEFLMHTAVHVLSEGREEYIPREMLRGLLPDALLERYKFWRHKAGDSDR